MNLADVRGEDENPRGKTLGMTPAQHSDLASNGRAGPPDLGGVFVGVATGEAQPILD